MKTKELIEKKKKSYNQICDESDFYSQNNHEIIAEKYHNYGFDSGVEAIVNILINMKSTEVVEYVKKLHSQLSHIDVILKGK